jgi:hypothetical protein
MEFQELLAPVSGEPDIADALKSWDWLVPVGARAILATALGDVFVTDVDGSVSFLDIVSGRCDRVAESIAKWDEMLHDPEFLERHFTPGFVALLRERSGILAQGECYVPKREPALGGSWEADNWAPGKWVWHLERQGRVHFAIKDLPEGTPITAWNYTEL